MIQTLSGRQFPAAVIPLIDAAKSSIDIVVYAWVWYPSDPGATCQLFNQAIIRAARRGVKIRAIINNAKTLQALQSQNIEAKALNTSKLVHAKLMIIDSEKVITGSHNYTQFAFHINFELSLVLDGENVAKDFNIFFQNLWNLDKF
jgi:phosphatidylserine/phosphatidylglycerophosphate/cardiolipin synthase-like enzyme